MTNDQKQIERQLARLKRAIQHLVISSREFTGLRQLLRGGQCELQLYLVPMAPGAPKPKDGGGDPNKCKHLLGSPVRLSLTAEDQRFLKKAGIKF